MNEYIQDGLFKLLKHLDSTLTNLAKVDIYVDYLETPLRYEAQLLGGVLLDKTEPDIRISVSDKKEFLDYLLYYVVNSNPTSLAYAIPDSYDFNEENFIADIQATYIPENRAIVLTSKEYQMLKYNGLNDVVSFLNYQIILKQTLLYQHWLPRKQGSATVAKIAGLFQSAILIPNQLGSLNSLAFTDTFETYADYKFENMKGYLKPITVLPNGERHRTNLEDCNINYTFIFRNVDLIDLLGDLSSGERQRIMTRTPLLTELILASRVPESLLKDMILTINTKTGTRSILPMNSAFDLESYMKLIEHVSLFSGKHQVTRLTYAEYLSIISAKVLSPERIVDKLQKILWR